MMAWRLLGLWFVLLLLPQFLTHNLAWRRKKSFVMGFYLIIVYDAWFKVLCTISFHFSEYIQVAWWDGNHERMWNVCGSFWLFHDCCLYSTRALYDHHHQLQCTIPAWFSRRYVPPNWPRHLELYKYEMTCEWRMRRREYTSSHSAICNSLKKSRYEKAHQIAGVLLKLHDLESHNPFWVLPRKLMPLLRPWGYFLCRHMKQDPSNTPSYSRLRIIFLLRLVSVEKSYIYISLWIYFVSVSKVRDNVVQKISAQNKSHKVFLWMRFTGLFFHKKSKATFLFGRLKAFDCVCPCAVAVNNKPIFSCPG